jgi:hypothetical protein
MSFKWLKRIFRRKHRDLDQGEGKLFSRYLTISGVTTGETFTDDILCSLCDTGHKCKSPAIRCNHEYCTHCIDELQRYKPGDFVDNYKHQCPECRQALILNPCDEFHKQIIEYGTKQVDNKYVSDDYYRFCLQCKKVINAGSKSCHIDRERLRPDCNECDPFVRTRICKCGCLLEWDSGCQHIKCPHCHVNICFIHNKTEHEITERLKLIVTSSEPHDATIIRKLKNLSSSVKLTLVALADNSHIIIGNGGIVYMCPWCAEDDLLYDYERMGIDFNPYQHRIKAIERVEELNKEAYMVDGNVYGLS